MSVPSVSVAFWGKDHWSTFAYVETVCVDSKGVPSRDRMRCNPLIHQDKMGKHQNRDLSVHNGEYKYPTRLKGNLMLINHDDWSCMEDCEAIGLVDIMGTGINPVFKMTPLGFDVSHQLRTHKASGGQFGDFEPKIGALA